jgi:hypothetical protein
MGFLVGRAGFSLENGSTSCRNKKGRSCELNLSLVLGSNELICRVAVDFVD